MANPLKVLTDLIVSGSTSTSGSLNVGGNGGLTVANGLTVSGGSVTLPSTSIANAALQGSGQVTVGSTSIALGATATSIEGLTTVDTTNLDVSNVRAKDGASAITIADVTGIVTITNLTASTIDINGGVIDNTAIGATTQSSAKFTTISGSGNLSVGGASTLVGAVTAQGGITVTGAPLNASTVAVSASAVSASSFVGNGSGLTGVIAAGVAPDSVALGTGTTGNYVTSVAATTNGGIVITNGTEAEGSNPTVGLKNADSLTSNKVLKWDDSGNQLVNSSITDDGSKVTLTTELTGTHAYFANNLTVVGTASFGQLNVVNQQSLNIGDKYIVVASGSTGHENLEGAGMLWGSGAVGATLFPDADAHAAIVYRNANDRLEIFPGLSSSFVTASVLNVVNEAKFDGAVTLGNAASDVITALGELTASAGISATHVIVSSGSVKDASLPVAGMVSSTGSVFGLTGFENDARFAIVSASFHGGGNDIEATAADVKADIVSITANGGVPGLLSGVNIEGKGVSITSTEAAIPQEFDSISLYVGTGGGQQLAGGNIKLSAETIRIDAGESSPTGTLMIGMVNVATNDNFTYITKESKYPVNTINLTGALKQLDQAIASVGSVTTVTPTEYYNVRTVVSGTKQSGNSTVVFTLSGNIDSQGGRTPNGSSITGLSASSAEGASRLIQRLGGMSFDVAIRDMVSNLWSNDLVSVQVSASALSNGFYWPIITVDAPAATTGAEIRLIAVNETANVIS